MKFNNVVESCIGSMSSLRKVRIKVDPKNIMHPDDLLNKEGYEGYILEEGINNVKILVLPPDIGIADIPVDLIEYIADENHHDVLDSLKQYIVSDLNLKEGDPVINQLVCCQDLNEIEAVLRQQNFNDAALADLYKEFISS